MRTGVRMATRLPDHIFMEAEQSNDDRNVLLYIQEFEERSIRDVGLAVV